MDLADHTTEDLNALRCKPAGRNVPFEDDHEYLIEDIRRLQATVDRHLQPERPGVVFAGI